MGAPPGKVLDGLLRTRERTLQAVASHDFIAGLVEVWPEHTHPDAIWTDLGGDGYNVLGSVFFRLVQVVREGYVPPLSDDATNFLNFDSFQDSLKDKTNRQCFKYDVPGSKS